MAQTCFTLNEGLSTIIMVPNIIGSDVVFNSGATYSTSYCGRYALLYQNAYGGWDSFLIEGTVFKSTNYTQNTYAKAYDNNTLDRETWNYANELSETYTCTTGWLSDRESALFCKHLLTSPDIFLQDIQEDRIIPVTMTPANNKEKTYQNEGKKMVNYQFILKAANSKVRQY